MRALKHATAALALVFAVPLSICGQEPGAPYPGQGLAPYGAPAAQYAGQYPGDQYAGAPAPYDQSYNGAAGYGPPAGPTVPLGLPYRTGGTFGSYFDEGPSAYYANQGQPPMMAYGGGYGGYDPMAGGMGGAPDPAAMGGGFEPFEQGCGSESGCGTERVWITMDAANYWMEGQSSPPLVTTSPPGTPQAQAGVIGALGTRAVPDGGELNEDGRFGGRFGFGYWFARSQCLGIEGSYLLLENESTDYTVYSGGETILARPFFDLNAGVNSSAIIALPDAVIDPLGGGAFQVDVGGGINVDTYSRFQSADLMLRRVRWGEKGGPVRVDLLGGYRFVRLDEGISISDTFSPLGFPFVNGTHLDSVDNFYTENQFHGGQIGLVTNLQKDRLNLEVKTMLALGNVHQVVEVSGSNTTYVPGNNPITSEGGLLAQPSNIGRTTNDEFALIPELYARLSYGVTDNLRASVGYNFVYLTDFVRPGDQIDTVLNTSQVGGGALVGEPRPTREVHEADFFLQGITAGLEFRR